MKLRTIGYEGAQVSDLVATLVAAGVTMVLDIRQITASRRKGFSKSQLAAWLSGSGIAYRHLRGLGDPKEGRDAAKLGDVRRFEKIFVEHLRTADARTDLATAVEIVQSEEVCLLCYERDHLSCHRKIVADKIKDVLGLSIQHLGVRHGIARDRIGQRGQGESPCVGQSHPSCG